MYQVNYKCSNCGWEREKHFSYGEEAPETTVCNNCHCYTADKMWRQTNHYSNPLSCEDPWKKPFIEERS